MDTVLGNLRHKFVFEMMRWATVRVLLKPTEEAQENSIYLQKH